MQGNPPLEHSSPHLLVRTPEISPADIEAMNTARLGFPLIRKREEPTRQVGALVALNRLGKPVYAGTVPAAVKARRRARNKAARHARRVHRR